MKDLALLVALCLLLAGCGAASADLETQASAAPALVREREVVDTGVPVAELSRAAAPQAQVIELGWATDCVVDLGVENLVVRQEGAQLTIEVDAGTLSGYSLRDNRDVPRADRYFYYANWDLIFERDRDAEAPVYAGTVTLTIPESPEETVFLYLKTDGGSIQAEGLCNVDLIIESGRGDVRLSDATVRHVDARGQGRIELRGITAQMDVIVNNRSHFTGAGETHTVVLDAVGERGE